MQTGELAGGEHRSHKEQTSLCLQFLFGLFCTLCHTRWDATPVDTDMPWRGGEGEGKLWGIDCPAPLTPLRFTRPPNI